MPWPQPTEYNAAVQNPRACFADPDLRQGQAVGDLFGLPRPHAGNFADVYQIEGADGQSWAVKCFTREVHGLHERYQAISDHLGLAQRPFMVDFRYLEEGIRIRGLWFPVLKMRWIEGLTLNAFLREHADKPAILERLAQMWLRMAQELREVRIAHGDLQHGNVLLVARTSPLPGKSSLALRLIDYDGMHVPALADSPSGEVGHPNYQHPQRVKQSIYDGEADRFSHLVIYTALRCLVSGGKSLWEHYDNSENILFRHEDFRHPRASRLFRELWSLPDPHIRPLVGRLLLAAQGGYCEVPLLEDLACPGPASDDPGARARPAILPLTAGEEVEVRSLLRIDAPPRRTRLGWGSAVVTPLPSAPSGPPPLPDYPAAVAVAVPPATATEVAPAAPVPTTPVLPAAPPLPVSRPTPAPPRTSPLRVTLRRLAGLAADRPALVGGAAAVAAAVVLVTMLMSSLGRRPKPPPAPKPQLLRPDSLVLKGGRKRDVLIRVNRNGHTGPLTIKVDGLPPKVSGPESLEIAPGEDSVRLPLSADRDASDAGRLVSVTLWADGGQVGNPEEFTLTLRKFHYPLLRDPDPIDLRPGQPRVMQFEVDPNGCDEPLTVRLEDAPAQVRQEVIPVPVGSTKVRVRLTADATAEPGWSFPRVVLSAGGLQADTRVVKMTVEGATPPVRLEGPMPVTLEPGKPQTLTVTVKRGGYRGELEVGLDVFPPWLGWTPAIIPAKANSTTLEIEAGEGAYSGRVSARIQVFAEGRKADAQTLWINVRGAPPAPTSRRPKGRPVRFLSADQVELRGTFYPGSRRAAGLCVLLLHDLGGDRHRAAWEPLAEALQAQGHSVLRFDFRGHGASTTVAPGFWNFAHNQMLPVSKAAGRAPPVFIHAADFPPAYLPRLAQDVTAARTFLEGFHDAGDVNLSNLVVIGAGQGATLGALWLASESHRFRLTSEGPRRFAPQPEVRHVAAAVWLSPRGTLGTRAVPLVGWLYLASRTYFIPMALLHGEDDRIGDRWARYILAQLKVPPDLALTTRTPIAGTNAAGEHLLRKDLNTQQTVLTYLGTVMDLSPLKPWVARHADRQTFYWVFEKREVLAQLPGQDSKPLPLPLLGITP